jgi:AcrR family transcriptional regulator
MFQYPAVVEMEERSRRIVETAVELAEQGGFEAVRLRDVAAHAGVALGTLYRRFRSKEDLLVAALDCETLDLERRILQQPPKGDSSIERVASFFSVATRGLCRRPNLARALLKAASSGDRELASRVASFHDRMEQLIIVSLRGRREGVEDPTELEKRLAFTLEMIWYGLLVGWCGGLQTQASVIEQMRLSSEFLLKGAREAA